MIRKSLFMITLLAVLVSTGYSQNNRQYSEYFYFGGFFGVNYNIYNADFSELPDIPSCSPNFNNGDGFGFNGGLLVGYAFLDRFSAFAHIGMVNLGGELVTEEIKPFIYGNIMQDAKIQHSIDAGLNGVKMGLGFEFKITKLFSGLLKVNLIKLYKYDYTQKESILSPDGIVFENGERVRNTQSGKLPGINSLNSSVSIGLRYYLGISNKLYLCPEINYHLGLVNILKGVDWKVSSTNLIINLIYIPKMGPSTPLNTAY